jgi:hypothetical protein
MDLVTLCAFGLASGFAAYRRGVAGWRM